jgi:hypothetical protein
MFKKKKKKTEEASDRQYLFRMQKSYYPARFWRSMSGWERFCLITAAAMLISLAVIYSERAAIRAALGGVMYPVSLYIVAAELVPVVLVFLFLWMRSCQRSWWVALEEDRVILDGEMIRRKIPYKAVRYIVRGDMGPALHPYPGWFGPSAISYRRRFGDYLNAVDENGAVLFSLREEGDAFSHLHGKCPGARIVEIEDYAAMCREIAPDLMSPALLAAWDKKNK